MGLRPNVPTLNQPLEGDGLGQSCSIGGTTESTATPRVGLTLGLNEHIQTKINHPQATETFMMPAHCLVLNGHAKAFTHFIQIKLVAQLPVNVQRVYRCRLVGLRLVIVAGLHDVGAGVEMKPAVRAEHAFDF